MPGHGGEPGSPPSGAGVYSGLKNLPKIFINFSGGLNCYSGPVGVSFWYRERCREDGRNDDRIRNFGRNDDAALRSRRRGGVPQRMEPAEAGVVLEKEAGKAFADAGAGVG